jgi:hypothetical protein
MGGVEARHCTYDRCGREAQGAHDRWAWRREGRGLSWREGRGREKISGVVQHVVEGGV